MNPYSFGNADLDDKLPGEAAEAGNRLVAMAQKHPDLAEDVLAIAVVMQTLTDLMLQARHAQADLLTELEALTNRRRQ